MIKSFKEALKEAQEKGFAERDPSDDIDGNDTANKIRILVNLITNSYQKVPPFTVEGIRDITYSGYSICRGTGVFHQTGWRYRAD